MAYPSIAKACQLIALDNGGIHRERSVKKWESDLANWIEHHAEARFPNIGEIETWLGTLTDEQLDTVCCGGQGEPEQEAAMVGAPPFTDEFLTVYFEEVC